MTRVLVLWADPNAANLGLRALAEGAAAVAAGAYGEVVVEYHSHNTANSPLKMKRAVLELLNRKKPLRTYFSQFDAVFDTGGGDSFTDIYGLRRLVLMSLVTRTANKARCMTVMTPQTVGPFKNPLGRVLARRMLKSFDVVTTRDPESSACSRSLGRTPDVEATDLVFRVAEPDPTDHTATVLMNVSGLLWEPNPHVDHQQYRRDVYDLIDRLIEAKHKTTLLAHVLDSGLPDTDVHVVRALNERYAGQVGILIPETLSEVRSRMASSTIVVGSRMHACLNALSVGTAAVAWSYSRKFQPLMASIGWKHSMDLRNADDIVSRTFELCERAVRGELSDEVGHATEVAAKTLVHFENLLEDRTAPR